MINLKAFAFREGVEIRVTDKDKSLTIMYNITERDAERLYSDLQLALRDLDKLRLKRQAEAHNYMETA